MDQRRGLMLRKIHWRINNRFRETLELLTLTLLRLASMVLKACMLSLLGGGTTGT